MDKELLTEFEDDLPPRRYTPNETSPRRLLRYETIGEPIVTREYNGGLQFTLAGGEDFAKQDTPERCALWALHGRVAFGSERANGFDNSTLVRVEALNVVVCEVPFWVVTQGYYFPVQMALSAGSTVKLFVEKRRLTQAVDLQDHVLEFFMPLKLSRRIA